MNKRTDELVKQNLGLVGLVVNGFVKENQDRDDLFQIGSIGLIKAANGFDETKNIKFTTYAAQCIRNEILMEFRRQGGKSRNAPTLSFEAPIKQNNEEKKLVVGDMIADQKQNFEEQKECIEMLEEVLNYIMNKLECRARYIVLCRAGGINQEEIAADLGISQSFVSRIESKASDNLDRVSMTNVSTDGRYKVELKNGDICLSFDGNKELMHNVFCEIDVKRYVKSFLIEYYKKNVIIRVPADNESLPFIAKVVTTVEK